MKIVVLDGYTENPGDLSWKDLESLGETTIYDRTPVELVEERIGDAEIVITNKTPIDKEIFEKCQNIKYVGVLATGYNVVDVNTAAEKGIPVCNIPTYGTTAVAQMVFALLLEICHHVGTHSEAVKMGEWSNNVDWCFWKYPLIELAGKTMGIVGFGRIGKAVGRLAKAFGMNVLAYDLYPDYNFAREHQVVYCTLDELYHSSDIISLHCPLTEQTKYLINDYSISKMKDGVMIINTGRGQLIHTNALIEGLKTKKVGYAGLDVYEEEEPYFYEDKSDKIIDDDTLARLLSFNNVIVTSHQAFFTKEAMTNIAHTTLQNVKDFAESRSLVNEVAVGRV